MCPSLFHHHGDGGHHAQGLEAYGGDGSATCLGARSKGLVALYVQGLSFHIVQMPSSMLQVSIVDCQMDVSGPVPVHRMLNALYQIET